MSLKLRVLISAMLLTPAVALGLGLGEIRLKSALNEPFSAEIDLVAATPDEIGALEAQLASAEVFRRYGLDRPAFLNSIEFRVGRSQDGRNVLLVRSTDAISEPFVSFLVDVNWSRGRLLREYTVLLDPPVMAAPGAGAARAPVAAPTTMPAAPRTAPTPASSTAAADAAPVTDGTTYRVERGDTLYQIASSLTGGDRQATQRMMIGIFRSNPEAFSDNINVMRAGAILRVPATSEVSDIAAADAAGEISRQTAAWRAAGGGQDSGRLRLVTPPEGAADAGTADPATSGRVESQIESLERDINEQRRLLELRNQELAKLQQDLARTRAAEQAAADQAAADQRAADQAAADQAAADQAAADQAQVPPTDESAVAPEDDTPRVETPPEAATPEPEARPEPVPVAAGKSFLESLTDNWVIVAGAIGLLLLGLFGYGYVRRRREEDVDVALKGFELPATAPVPSETMRLRALAMGDATAEIERPRLDDDDGDDLGRIVVEERPIARPKAEAARPSAGHEETISAEAALDLDQADPLAEADFHMAYGLYDQAVDLVRMALQHSPDRNDLKLKLAEIHFVAGDTQQFLTVARDLRKTLGPGGDWDRIVIMGRQLAPDEPMFAGGVRDAGVDLSLEGGDNLVDIDLLSAPEGDEGLDLDLGKVAAISDSNDATGENTAIELNLDDVPLSPTTTQKIVKRDGPGTVEMPTLELPSSETPTVETPALRLRGNDASRGRGDQVSGIATDATAEMAIDDLGLDLGDLGNLPDADDATAIATGVDEDETQIARRDDSTQLMTLEDESTALMPGSGTSATSMLPKLDPADLDFDLGGTTDTDESPTARNRMVTEQLPQLSELEPVTMSEVGTKLDLARAYMDMGDPDGARNILQEVLAEGSASQKQEARRLIDSLPGA